jgi:hypothetical protein
MEIVESRKVKVDTEKMRQKHDKKALKLKAGKYNIDNVLNCSFR